MEAVAAKYLKKPEEKFTVLNGVLHVGELPTQPKYWVTQEGKMMELNNQEPNWKKNLSKLAWRAKLEKRRKLKKQEN